MTPSGEGARWLRQAFGAFPSGVVALAALVEGVPHGLAASSFTSVSLDPPLVSVCIAHSSTTWPRLRQASRLGISIFAGHQEHQCRRLAARDVDRFADIGWRATEDGAVLIHDSSGWFDTSVDEVVPAGDHDMALLRVHDFHVDPGPAPLVVHASLFRQLAAGE